MTLDNLFPKFVVLEGKRYQVPAEIANLLIRKEEEINRLTGVIKRLSEIVSREFGEMESEYSDEINELFSSVLDVRGLG